MKDQGYSIDKSPIYINLDEPWFTHMKKGKKIVEDRLCTGKKKNNLVFAPFILLDEMDCNGL